MNADQIDALSKFKRDYGKAAPPDRVTQEAYDGDDRHLYRLVQLKPSERARTEDLSEYMQDVRYTEVQAPLLVFLLPFCLDLWREDLRGTGGHGGFVEHLYPALADREVFGKHLTPKQSTAVSEFMRKTILEEIDAQRGLTNRGASFGVILPHVDKLWAAWWSLDTAGRAVAALQYISCLMYPENENPVFAPWTPNDGGGPPCLWEFEGHLHMHRWLEPNTSFLKHVLNVALVSDALNRATYRLAGQPELGVADVIREDLPVLAETLQARCSELPRLLETKGEPGKLHAWTA